MDKQDENGNEEEKRQRKENRGLERKRDLNGRWKAELRMKMIGCKMQYGSGPELA